MKRFYVWLILVSGFLGEGDSLYAQTFLENLNKTYQPVVVSVQVSDVQGKPLDTAAVWIEKKNGKKIFFKHIEGGQYTRSFSNRQAVTYPLYAQLGERTEKRTLTVEGTSEEAKTQAEAFTFDLGSKKPVLLEISIYDDQEQLVDGEITIVDLNDKKIEGIERVEQGVYQVTFNNTEAHEYNISVAENDFLYENIMVYVPAATRESQTLEEAFKVKVTSEANITALSVPKVGKRVVLRSVYFQKGAVQLAETSLKELDKLVVLLEGNPTAVIEIGGHTDNVGSAYQNKVLSQQRAEAVLTYITSKGIGRDRLKAVGYGEERPIASNDDEKEGRELNRRTDFVILEM
ncbi:MAG: OmpA family protein [Bacteroidota bacterium]